MGNLLLLLELQVASGGCDVAKDGAESSSWLGNFTKTHCLKQFSDYVKGCHTSIYILKDWIL